MNKIIHGDSIDELKLLDADSIDAIVTDPPYFLTNSNGSGFMGKDWDGIKNLWIYLWSDKKFVSNVIKLLEYSKVERNITEEFIVQQNVNIKELEKEEHKNVQYANLNLRFGSALKNASVPVIVFTKQNLLDLCKELSGNHIKILEEYLSGEEKNVSFAIPILLPIQENKHTAVGSVISILKAGKCQERKTTFTSTETQKIKDVIEEMIGDLSGRQYTKEINGLADFVVSTATDEKYSVTIYYPIKMEEATKSITLLLYAMFAIQGLNKIQEDLITNFFRTISSECIRVLKPGGHMLAFSSTRTYHRMVCAIEDSGFEIRDQLAWIYGSGFPKSQNVGKMIDKKAGAKRKVVGEMTGGAYCKGATGVGIGEMIKSSDGTMKDGRKTRPTKGEYFGKITEPSTELAKKYDGWGTALKPAQEPIVLARKPLSEKTVAANVLKYGTGAIDIDSSRVGNEIRTTPVSSDDNRDDKTMFGMNAKIHHEREETSKGRWPANIIHDGSEEVLEIFPDTKSPKQYKKKKAGWKVPTSSHEENDLQSKEYGDSGSAARFFYCAKANKQDRNSGIDKCVTSTYITGLCKEENMELVALLQKDTFVSMVKWNIDEYGKAITATCQKECLSTILTKINKTTILQICDSLMQSLTKEYTQNANCEMDNGISLVKNADNTNILSKTTTKEKMVYLPDVKSVVSKMLSKISKKESWQESKNGHATVKPTELMKYLIKLITPPNGTVLDPFMGSGSTGKAAALLGNKFIGIDMTAEYIPIATARIQAAVDIYNKCNETNQFFTD